MKEKKRSACERERIKRGKGKRKGGDHVQEKRTPR